MYFILRNVNSKKQKTKMRLKDQKKIDAVYREGTVINRMCQKWFAKSCAGYFLPKQGRCYYQRTMNIIQRVRQPTCTNLVNHCNNDIMLVALMCNFHLSQALKNFLKQIMASNEKQIFYNNTKGNQNDPPQSKVSLYGMEILYALRYLEDTFYYEPFQDMHMIDSDKYYFQLEGYLGFASSVTVIDAEQEF